MALYKTIYNIRCPDVYYNIMLNDKKLPKKGYLEYSVLNPAFGVSCNINLKSTEYEYNKAIISFVGNQVKSKSLRSSNNLQNRDNSIVLYRDNLVLDIHNYLVANSSTALFYTSTKSLLLNDLTLDTYSGDAGISPLFRFERPDKTSSFFLSPGFAYKYLIELIGLNLFSIDIDLEEFISELISDMASFYIQEIVPSLHITCNQKLKEDIERYMRMAIYGV